MEIWEKSLMRGWSHKNGVLLLVYDYMPNGSLDKHLFGGAEQAILTWEQRYNIVAGVASALHYLHNEYDQKVVHRDLKASNIILDSAFNARLGDLGLARALDTDKTSYTDLDLSGVPGTRVFPHRQGHPRVRRTRLQCRRPRGRVRASAALRCCRIQLPGRLGLEALPRGPHPRGHRLAPRRVLCLVVWVHP